MRKIVLIAALFISSLVQAFTYQGELSQSGALFTGSADIRFTMYDAPSNGVAVGNPDLHKNVDVANGRFVVDLDEWNGLYDGTPLWLEIEVDLNDTGAFTTLVPRQKLAPVPYSEFTYDGAGGSGDITAVTAGTGLSGGGSSGDVALSVDGSVVQNRVTGTCAANSSIRTINQDGTVVCEIDNVNIGDITNVIADFGLHGGGTQGQVILSVNTTEIQERVIDNCPAGSSIRKIASDGSVTCEVDDTLDPESVWLTSGNAGIDDDTDFIGTLDRTDFVIKANGFRALRIDPETSTRSSNILLGESENHISSTNDGATISGGGDYHEEFCGWNANDPCNNAVYDNFGTVAGGRGNYVLGPSSTVSGGQANIADSFFSVVSGGRNNFATDEGSVVSGGILNEANGTYSVVPGGKLNFANGSGSWAGGTSATSTLGSFVWDGDADSDDTLTASGAWQFVVRAPGGAWFGTDSGSISPAIDNVAMHIEAKSGSDGMRVRIGGNTKLRMYSNGGTALGSNTDISNVPTNGLRVSGDVTIAGSLSKGGGSFRIDHPLDPQNKNLYHSFVESPDMMNIYNGNVITDDSGMAWVEMPEWFEALNRDFRYQLTTIGSFDRAMIAEEIQDNRFLIRTESAGVKVSWQVTGVRHDAWANMNRIPVEEDKADDEKGKYLHPEAWQVDKKMQAGLVEESQ